MNLNFWVSEEGRWEKAFALLPFPIHFHFPNITFFTFFYLVLMFSAYVLQHKIIQILCHLKFFNNL